MKLYKKLASVLIASMALTNAPVVTMASDYESHWASEAIEKWTEKNIMEEFEDGTFRPDEPVTRAQFAKVIVDLMGYTSTEGSSNFTDVTKDKWYSDYVKKISAADVMHQTGAAFKPLAEMTHEEAAYALANVYKLENNEMDKAAFKDEVKISDWALDKVKALYNAGYITADEDGNFNPKAVLTRAELVTMIDRLNADVVNTKGVYSQNITGNLVVNTTGVTLKDMTIDGDLYLAEGIGEGDVDMQNVTVNGRVIVEGGGVNSIRANKGCKFMNPILTYAKNPVRFVNNSASVSIITMASTNIILVGNFSDVNVGAGSKVTFDNAKVVTVTTQTIGVMPIMEIRGTSIVDRLIAAVSTSIQGNGTIGELVANAKGVSSTIEPNQTSGNEQSSVSVNTSSDTNSNTSNGSDVSDDEANATKPETDEPGTDKPGTDEPGTDKPGTDEPGTDKPGTDQPGTDQPGTDQPGTNTPGTDQPGTDQPGTDQPGTDQPGTDQPGTDQPGTDQPGTETPADNSYTISYPADIADALKTAVEAKLGELGFTVADGKATLKDGATAPTESVTVDVEGYKSVTIEFADDTITVTAEPVDTPAEGSYTISYPADATDELKSAVEAKLAELEFTVTGDTATLKDGATAPTESATVDVEGYKSVTIEFADDTITVTAEPVDTPAEVSYTISYPADATDELKSAVEAKLAELEFTVTGDTATLKDGATAPTESATVDVDGYKSVTIEFADGKITVTAEPVDTPAEVSYTISYPADATDELKSAVEAKLVELEFTVTDDKATLKDGATAPTEDVTLDTVEGYETVTIAFAEGTITVTVTPAAGSYTISYPADSIDEVLKAAVETKLEELGFSIVDGKATLNADATAPIEDVTLDTVEGYKTVTIAFAEGTITVTVEATEDESYTISYPTDVTDVLKTAVETKLAELGFTVVDDKATLKEGTTVPTEEITLTDVKGYKTVTIAFAEGTITVIATPADAPVKTTTIEGTVEAQDNDGHPITTDYSKTVIVATSGNTTFTTASAIQVTSTGAITIKVAQEITKVTITQASLEITGEAAKTYSLSNDELVEFTVNGENKITLKEMNK